MHLDTLQIKKRLAFPSSLEEKVHVLKGAYSGSEGLVISCGPSLAATADSELQAAAKGRVVVAVKQAIDRVSQFADFHIYNHWNYQRFAYPHPAPIRVSCSTLNAPRVFGEPPDLRLPVRTPVSDRAQALSNSMAGRRDFEMHLLSNTLVRPWGPGIMYECVLYLLLHMGLKKVVCVGWDLGTAASCAHTHFYDTTSPDWPRLWGVAQKGWRGAARVASSALGWPGLHNRIETWESALLHVRGRRYNVPPCVDGENEVVVDSSDDMYGWLQRKGVTLMLASDCSRLSSSIPRCRLSKLGVPARTGAE